SGNGCRLGSSRLRCAGWRSGWCWRGLGGASRRGGTAAGLLLPTGRKREASRGWACAARWELEAALLLGFIGGCGSSRSGRGSSRASSRCTGATRGTELLQLDDLVEQIVGAVRLQDRVVGA